MAESERTGPAGTWYDGWFVNLRAIRDTLTPDTLCWIVTGSGENYLVDLAYYSPCAVGGWTNYGTLEDFEGNVMLFMPAILPPLPDMSAFRPSRADSPNSLPVTPNAVDKTNA